jgi:hypothetical protein
MRDVLQCPVKQNTITERSSLFEVLKLVIKSIQINILPGEEDCLAAHLMVHNMVILIIHDIPCSDYPNTLDSIAPQNCGPPIHCSDGSWFLTGNGSDEVLLVMRVLAVELGDNFLKQVF